MAAKKYYAVKKGKVTGIFQTWDECRSAVEGYSGAQYKGFSTLKEAEEYLGGVCSGQAATGKEEILSGGHVQGRGKSPLKQAGAEEVGSSCLQKVRQKREMSRGSGTDEIPDEGELVAYVDGGYAAHIREYAVGCVFLLPG
ncbi:MAG: RNase H1/viroplasmin domain-containing protein, partial [Acetatifactor sp.]|nr:RNase H1/viroplasmin domain-containing protein [Acetatifactor sp.]